jgi:hypothetical protein
MGKFSKLGVIEIDCRAYQLLQGIRQRLFSEMGEGFLSVMSNHSPLERPEFKNGLVNFAARRRVDGGAELAFSDASQLETEPQLRRRQRIQPGRS